MSAEPMRPREETAHRVAWSAVKASYEKRESCWVATRAD